MSDISEPQDLEKAHISGWFPLTKILRNMLFHMLSKLDGAGYVLHRNYSFMRLSSRHLKLCIIGLQFLG